MSGPPGLEHRAYEQDAVRALRLLLPARRRVLAVAPTGSGKTVIGALLLGAEKRWRRVLWLAHRVELIEQARSRIVGLGMRCGVRCASYEQRCPEHVDPAARVQVGSIQTVIRRELEDVDLIVIDEAHRSMADSYQRLAELKPEAEVLGLTATPIRTDGRALGDFFHALHVIARPSQLYAGGYLVEPITYAAAPDARDMLSKRLHDVRRVGGDFQVDELGQAVNTHELVGNVVTEALRLAPRVPKVVFAATVQHSKQIAARFARAGVSTAHIDSETPAETRARALAALARGAVEVICNVEILTEGWDLPALGAVVIARPTWSLVRFMHMIGRVQRVGGPAQKLILDHGGNAERLQHFPGEDMDWELLTGGRNVAAPAGRAMPRVRICPGCSVVLLDDCEKCPYCGTFQPSSRRLIAEREAELELLEKGRIEKLRRATRRRVARVARKVGAPEGWIDVVVASLIKRTARDA
jgi:superfamily II DNA or RNA helicase